MVHLGNVATHSHNDRYRIEVDVSGVDDAPQTLWFELSQRHAPSEEAIADALFPLGLLMAMIGDGELTMSAPVSPSLLRAETQVQDILLSWHAKKLRRANVSVRGREPGVAVPANGVAACFTGGVDSFFTLVKNQSEITSLVYVHGFDIPLSRQDAFDTTVAHLRTVAAATNKELIEMSTNLKSFLSAVRWGPIAHGPALASIAMMLSGTHGTFLIPATHTYSDLYSWGSHPLVDPLWSTERVRVIHDGAEATRVQKTLVLGKNEVAREHLRVCWKNTGAYNCGVCEKCYRTKVCLQLAGTLSQFKTFDQEIDLDVVRSLTIPRPSLLAFVLENRDFARQVGNEEIAAALDVPITNYWQRQPVARSLAKRNLQLERERVRLVGRTRDLKREVSRLQRALDRLKARKAVRLANAAARMIVPTRRRVPAPRGAE